MAHAAAWSVNDTTDTPVGQACPGFTNCSLREAITSTEANPGPDAILVEAGTYPLTNGQLDVTQDLTVAKVGAGTVTISGSNASRIFHVDGGATSIELVLRFLTLTDGFVSDLPLAQGGAIYGDVDTTITIESSTISNSTVTSPDSAEGGGIWSEGAVTIGKAPGSTTGSVISGNLAQTTDNGAACGGGIAVVDGDGLTVGPGTMITGNQATAPNGFLGHGGGVWFASDGQQATFTEPRDGHGVVVRSTVSGNAVTSPADSGLAFGGGIAVTDDATLDLTSSTVAGNTATTTGLGGGALGGGLASSLYGPAGALTASNSTIAANSVSSS